MALEENSSQLCHKMSRLEIRSFCCCMIICMPMLNRLFSNGCFTMTPVLVHSEINALSIMEPCKEWKKPLARQSSLSGGSP